ncbi:MAG: DUF4349 domain-containing protein [Caldilineaceae bacterium]
MRSQARFRLLVIAAIAAFSLVLSVRRTGPFAAMDAAVSSDSAPAARRTRWPKPRPRARGRFPDRKIIGTVHRSGCRRHQHRHPAVTQLAAAAGGYVADASFYDRSVGETSMPAGNMTLRVPAAALDDVLAKLVAGCGRHFPELSPARM